MMFYLTTLNLAKFYTDDTPKLNEDETDMLIINKDDTQKHFDFLCRLPKRKTGVHEANVMNTMIEDVSNISLLAMVYEVNLVGFNPSE